MKIYRGIIGALIGGILAISCVPKKQVVSSKSLVGRSFDVVEMPGADSFTGGKPFLQFGTAGQLGGNTGCNGFFGEFKLNGNNLALNIQGATKMFCLEVNEEGFIELMQKVDSFNFSGNELKLFGKGKLLVVLKERFGDK